MEAALASLHGPLDAPGGFWPAAADLFADQLHEAVLFGGGDADLERAALYAADRPADALAWLTRTRNARDDALYKARYKLIDLFTADVQRPQGGPGLAHCAAVFDECAWTCRFEHANEKVRQAAARCIRALLKRYGAAACDATKARAFVKEGLLPEVEQHKAPGGKKTGMQVARELYKLGAVVVSLNLDASEGEDRPDDASFMPWSEAAARLAKQMEAQLDKICARTAKDQKADSGPVLEGILGGMARLAATATLRDHFCANKLATYLVTILAAYRKGVYTGQSYGVPAAALRCVSRMAGQLARGVLAAASPKKRRSTDGADLCAAEAFQVLWAVAAAPPHGADRINERVDKYAAPALEGWLAALAADYTGVEWTSVFDLLAQQLQGADVLARSRHVSLALRCCGALAVALDRGNRSNRMVEAALALARRCDALGGGDDEAALGLLTLRAAALHAAAALVAAQASAAPQTGHLDDLGRVASRCLGAHIGVLARRDVSRWAHKVLVDALVAFVTCCTGRGAIAALADAARTAVACAAARHGGRRRAFNPSSGLFDDRACFAAAALWLDVFAKSPPAARVAAYDALIAAGLGLLASLDLRYDDAAADDEGRGGVVPLHPLDHELALNVTSFLERFVPGVDDASLFRRWAEPCLRDITRLSAELPKVSALYRVARVAITAADRAGAFPRPPSEEDPFLGTAQREDAAPKEDVSATLAVAPLDGAVVDVLRRYVAAVARAAPSFAFDELLAAACAVVLDAPWPLRSGQLHVLAGCCVAALRAGAAHAPTAKVALAAVETWRREQRAELAGVLADLLPEVEAYVNCLGTAAAVGDAAASSRLSDRARAKATEAASRYSAAQQHVGDAASRVLGRAALRIIAGLGGDASALLEQQADPLGWSTPNASGVDDGRIELTLNGLLDLADDADDDPGEASKDDTSKRRRRQASPPRARPRADAVVLRLDLLLPRVSAVARSKGPRQTRVAAAEALHSILLAAVGRAAKGGPDTGLDRVFARAFPAVIELAADSLAVIRTMFEMLLLQLCRWLAAKWMLATAQGEATARALLEALFDAATAQATKVSDQRDVASRALAELVKYVVKQHTKDELDALMGTHATDKSFDALGAVFARIVADVSQPHDASKRLGAAMCLQRLIRPLRDEASLVSRFGLELLRGALRAISYDDDEAAGASTGPTRTGGAGGQAREAAAHASQAAERLCLVLRHHVLKRLDAAQLLTDVGVRTKRREPRSLRHLVDWLFVEGVGATHHAFRRRCWRCVDQLVPVLDDTARAAPDRAAPSVRDFVRRTVAAHAAPWQIFDHSHDDADALEPETLQRVRRAHATLHGYSCFVSCEFLGADDVLAWTAAPCAARQSAHAAAPRPLLVVAQVLRWCRDAHGRSGATPDADALQAERCAALRHAADLLAVLLDRAPEAVVAHAGLFWGADAIGVWLGALAVPEGVCGSPRASDDVETKLPTAIAHLLRHARRLDIAAGAALPESVRAALGHAPQWRLAQGDAMAVEGMGLQGAAENDDGDDDAHAVGALRVYAALRDARVEEYALGGVARVRAVGALLAQRFLASAERQRLARPIETHASRRFASKTLDLALDLGLEVCARLATNDAGSNNAGELAGSSLLGLLLAASDGGGVAALERRPDAIFAALVLRESWPTVAVAISTAVRCRSEALAMHLLRGALDWGAAHGVDRALLLAPLLGGEAPSSTDATRQPGALASTYRFFLASTYRDFGLVEVLLGLAPPLDARFAPLRLCVFSVVLKALTAALDDDDCVVGEAMDFDDADDDATQERRDAAACAATRLAAHFLPGFTLGAPDMPALATVGVAAAAKRPRGDAPRGEDATQAAADQAAAADVALRSRLATVFPADHDELVRSGAAAAQRRYALQLAAVADAYAATAAPQLLTQLTPQLNQLDEPHFFAAGLRRALRGALKAAAADRRGGLAGLLVDALERCGVCDRGARQRGWALPRKTGPSTVAALSKCIVAPGLERAQSQALVDVALAEVLGPAAAGQPKKKRGLDDGPTQALICSAVAAICDIGAMPYDALNAALLFVEALFDGLDGLCGDADDALSAAVADAFAAHSVACGPEERASAKAAARKLRNVTLQAAEVRLKAAGPTDDSAVRGANCAFLRFYIHVGCKTQSKPGIVARICFSLKDEQPWLDCINAVPQLAPAAYSLKVDADFTLKRRFAAADDESPLDAVQLGRFAHLSDFAKMMLASSTLGHSQAASQAHAVSTSGDESDFPLSQGGAVDDDDAGLEASSVAPPVLNEEEDEFELNDVNRHPCMGPLVDGTKKLLDFEFDKATRVRLGLADVAAGETSQAWLPALAARLANAAGNAAVFLVQFVLNVDGLKRYAATLRPAFVRALARHVAPASAQGVDHLLRDAVMLLSTKTWSTAKAADDEERGDLCAIASELVRKAHYAAGARRAKVVEANMFLLFGFVVAYRAAVFDHALSRFDWAQATLDLLGSAIHATGRAQAAPTSAGKQSEHARQTGLFLVRLVAMSAKSQVEARRDVFTAVLDCAAATSRVVHRAGAECAGILLKQLDVHDWRVEAQNLALDLEREGVLEKKKFSRFAALIAYAARSDVRFFNRRLALRALDCLTACGPRQRAEVLEALAAPHHAAAIASEELFECLHDKLGPLLADATRMMDDGFTTADTSEDGADADGFKATTKGARPLVQLNLLRLVLSRGRDLLQGQKSLGVCEQLVYAMGPQSLASSLHLYQDQELRAAGYELLMAVHDACDEADAAPRAGGGPYDALRKRTRAALLAGLADADADGMLETVDKRAAAQAPRETTIVDSPGKVARREAEDSDDDGIQMLTADPNPKPRTVVDISHLDDSDDEGRRRAQDAADAEDGAAAPRRGIRRTVYDYWHRRFPRPAQRRLDALLRDVFPAAEALPHRFAALLLLAPSADDWDETKLQATSLCDLSSALDVVGQRSRDSWAPALSLEAVLSSQSASQAASAPHMLASQLFKKSFGAERSAAPPGMLRATQGDSMAFDQTQLATQSDARAGGRVAALSTQLLFGALPGSARAAPRVDATSTEPTQAKRVRFASPAPGDGAALRPPKPRRDAVKLYREYHEGEMPNIAISVGDVLRPLMTLALRDGDVAALLVAQLVGELYAKRSARRRGAVAQQLERLLGDGAVAASAELVATLHRCALAALDRGGGGVEVTGDPQRRTPPDLTLVRALKPWTIAESAVRSQRYDSGAALLEALDLVSRSGSCYNSVRDDAAHVPDPQRQLALRRLYASLGEREAEFGICRAVFKQRDGATASPGALALACEERREYEAALRLYFDDAASFAVDGDAAAKRVGDARSLAIARRLGDWDAVVDNCDAAVYAPGDDVAGADERLWRLRSRAHAGAADGAETLKSFVDAIAFSDDSSVATRGAPHGTAVQEMRLDRLVARVDDDAAEKWALHHAPVALFVARLRHATAARARAGAESAEAQKQHGVLLAKLAVHTDAAFDRLGGVWAGLHACARAARVDVLNRLARLHDVDAYIRSAAGRANGVSAKWDASPLDTAQPGEWLVAARVREVCELHAAGSLEGGASEAWLRGVGASVQRTRERCVELALDGGEIEIAGDALRRLRDAGAPLGGWADSAVLDAGVLDARYRVLFARRALCHRGGDGAAHNARVLSLQAIESLGALLDSSGTAAAEALRLLRAGACVALIEGIGCGAVASEMVAQETTSLANEAFSDFEKCHSTTGELRFAEFLDEMARRCTLDRGRAEATCDASLLPAGATFAVEALKRYVSVVERAAAEAPHAVPRIISLVAASPAAAAAFADNGIPTRALVRWASQLVSLRVAVAAEHVEPTLRRLARDFPDALRAPLRFAKEAAGGGDAGLADLFVATRCDDAEAFAQALHGLDEAELRVKDGVEALHVCAAHGKRAEADALWRGLRATLFDSPHLLGSKSREFATQHRTELAKVESIMSRAWTPQDAAALAKLAAHFSGAVRNMPYQLWAGLDQFSQYLRQLDGALLAAHGRRIGVPGCLEGGGPGAAGGAASSPFVVACDPTLMVFASLRRPKRLTLRCSDARPRSFLVKGGEDLRNDDRIQQLFAAMRRELERADAAPAGRRARLTLRTYAVVPLTPRLGLIEWVADAAVLKSVMNAQWGARGTAALLAAGRARDSALGLDNRDYKSYHTSYQTKTRADAEGALARARAQLEAAECGAGALRRHLVATAQSPEALFSLRASFARSLGASSAACYLVGLGDRHLENMMLDRGDASIVHIDLAASFGLGASALPVPEFQPFRLTAELRAALAPTDARQVISHHIAASLERLQAPRARAALLATLDVFVREPVLDWLHHLDKSRKRRKDGADAAADDPLLHTWSPQRKVDAARDKLDGVHPLRVLLDELRCNPVVAARQSFAAIETILRSAAPGHPLADDDRPILAVPDQVAVLVGLATEPNVIARQWQGLTPWL